MPTYVYRCKNGHQVERAHSISDYDKYIVTCGECVIPMERVIQAPVLAFAAPEIRYESPRTGEVITSKLARENDLAKHNCIPYDPEMKTDQMRHQRESEDALEKSISETAEEIVEKMPTSKRAKLDSELKSGIGLETVRSTPVGG